MDRSRTAWERIDRGTAHLARFLYRSGVLLFWILTAGLIFMLCAKSKGQSAPPPTPAIPVMNGQSRPYMEV